MTRLLVQGASGRLGQIIFRLAQQSGAWQVTAAEKGGSLEPLVATTEVSIDVSVPEASVQIASLCARYGKPLVIGTTGHSDAQMKSIDTAAVMIIDDGVVVSQWGEISKPFNVHSIRKSFLSALYGTAVARREIDLYATLEHLGVDDNEPSLTPEEKQARVIDLLKARSGIYHAALYESPAMKAERST